MFDITFSEMEEVVKFQILSFLPSILILWMKPNNFFFPLSKRIQTE